MPEIPLRTYVSQLDNLIERKQVDEVIAHCRHILSLYPKHLDTYRLLGKALLEKGRHGDAADIFERVLSVVPDDFISQVGMSIVREDEANLEAALWHMERAFESAPANGAIQQELCRLYGRRDGVVPSKARLTRGALARMYTQGGLYLQAEAELKAALTDEPERIDLLTTLAQVYWQTDQPAQAAQTSAAVLQKLPYSLEANRILLNVFRDQGRPDDAAVYRQRLEAVDPYQAFADPAANGAGSGRVDAAKVQVSRLDYVTGMEDSGSPDWLASIGARFEEPAAAQDTDAQPDWLTAATTEPPAAAPQMGIQSGSAEMPDWLKDLETSQPNVSAATPAPAASNSPDWLKELGLGTEPFTPPSEAKEGLPDWLKSNTGPLAADGAPGSMPPTSAAAAAQRVGQDDAVTGPIPEGSLPDWMLEEASPAPAPAAEPQPKEWSRTSPLDETPIAGPSLNEMPAWLKAIAAEPMPELTPEPPAEAASITPVSEAPAEELSTLAPAAIPAWLQSAAPETAAQPASGDADVPDWLRSASDSTADPNALPDWLRVSTSGLSPATVDRFESERQSSIPVEPPAESIAELPQSTPEAEWAPEEAPEHASDRAYDEARDVPAWMTVVGGGAMALADLMSPEPKAESPADALAELSIEADEPIAEPDWLQTDVTGRDVPPAPDWFQPPTEAAAMPEPASDALPMEPTPSSEVPAWLQAIQAAAGTQPTPAEADELEMTPSTVEVQSTAELPDWLSEVGSAAPAPDGGDLGDITKAAMAATGDEPLAQPELELPPFLQPASPEALARAEQPYDFAPDEVTMADSNDDEEEMPLPADIPDWLKALAPVSPDPVQAEDMHAAPDATPARPTDEPPAGIDEDSLKWLADLKAQAALDAASGAPTSSDVPDWLTAAAAEPATDELAEAPAASLPPWAEPQAPGPSDTIVSWLSRKRTEDEAAPAAPAQAAAPSQPEMVDAQAETQASLEPAADIGAMDSDEAFRWLESLAARQGANPDELLGVPAEESASAETPVDDEVAAPMPAYDMAAEMPAAPAVETEQPAEEAVPETAVPAPGYAGMPDWLQPGAVEAEPEMSAGADFEPAAEATGYDSLPEWLRPGALADASLSVEDEPETMSADTAPAAGYAGLPDWLKPGAETMPEASELAEPTAEEPAIAAAASLPDWLREMEAAMPVEPLIDTAPSKGRREPTAEIEQPAAQAPEAEPAMAELEATEPAPDETMAPVTAEAAAEPAMLAQADAASDEDAAMRWLEGLAAQQGANADELFTAPEERPLTPPSWITAEQMRAMETAQTPEPESAAEHTEPAPMAPDEALRWLESLNARQSAQAEPAESEAEPVAEERPADVPAWFAEETLANTTPAETGPEAETVAAEPPEWLRAYVPAEAKPEMEAKPAEPEPAQAPVVDVDKLARLSERLAATRGAREQEAEMRFAEQRERDEEARRVVQERMEARWAAEAAEAAREPAAPAPMAEPTYEAPAVEAPAAEPPAREAPAPVPAVSSEALTEIMAAWTARVESGDDLPAVIREIESTAPVDTAPVPVVQLLGDAYVRANQLQKALDTYRQALRRL